MSRERTGFRLVGDDRALPAETAPGETRGTARLGPLTLELGGRLAEVELSYRTWGRLNEAGDNAVLLLHALTGDARAAGPGGWWEPLVGPGRTIDTDRAFVVCANVLGGCAGSTGPASPDPATGEPYAMGFPLVTIGDMVDAQRRLVERFGITRLVAVGGSMGGFQALEWATRHPDLVGGTVAIAAADRMGAQAIALHGEVGRRAIMVDPAWHGGDYQRAGAFPAAGLAVARMAAMVSYQSRESMAARFGRAPATRANSGPSFGGTFAVEGYLHHHGHALAKRFDANSYLYLTRAMDLYDLGRHGGRERWLRRLAAPLLLVGIRTDWLFPPDEIRALARLAIDLGAETAYAELDSIHGHDAFLKEWGQLDGLLRPVVGRVLTTMPHPAGSLARAG